MGRILLSLVKFPWGLCNPFAFNAKLQHTGGKIRDNTSILVFLLTR